MKKGFTLIELLISIAIAALLSLSVGYLLSSHTRLFAKVSRQTEHGKICSRVLDRITEDIWNAQSVSGNASVLTLVFPKETVVYEYKNGKVKRNNAYLTDSEDVAGLSFTYKGKLVGIKIDDYETKAFCRN
ncbi:hypothetical protein A2276_00400 [candidate division WOR-1 bacterium RIFOXYA12_FULL_43_27]|uniref:Prepilin-type N-terminal cleavage/methylation domain-containing protein n=1 Tax=candidate division WOR-1 bacterium RIFOXYC2_FULL_46_14 TaxID=1802587 RepID=A0A1F4U4B8_UNCSA|nr:MAG: hypothetical protein A2276_00400 [candidate division WOR-1 bacterium RIFOXYA12_FULL_43_27]OGC20844.1 MAG: hypothetical protein A2292_07475 [candidate division WOR-1 bacterium RIFOXYB2_FULL_46_45]OGC31419.1 MAG: hypothetical protein A2232_03975 [candidate division WOR-1 bacterium RIFOXYA2_FULL_46_56]OGC39825.1 MAG: hypothetical protein A2438_04810 [candidate division WOR-1 bacterium RIFOXYC2_FULL_46_14]